MKRNWKADEEKIAAAKLRREQKYLNEAAIEKKRQKEEEQAELDKSRKLETQVIKEKNANKAYSKQKSEIREAFLGECIYKVFKESLDLLPNTIMSPLTESNINMDLVCHSMVNDFINEEGCLDLLDRFSRKNIVLSEWSNIVQEATKKACAKENKNGEGKFLVPGEIKDDFFKSLANSTPEDITSSIKSRVVASIDQFLDSNKKTKDAVTDVINKANVKIDPEADADLSESAAFKAKAKYKQIVNDQHRNLLGEMVYRISKSAMKDDALNEDYKLPNGGLDINKVVATAVTMYTFLETVNTLDLTKVDENYINKSLQNL